MLTRSAIDFFLIGAISMASWVAGLYFLQFWRATRDRLFLIFAMAFWLLCLTRLALAISKSEETTYVYWVRLAAFVLILLAIVDKNRPRRNKAEPVT
jgi:hypothetical protein